MIFSTMCFVYEYKIGLWQSKHKATKLRLLGFLGVNRVTQEAVGGGALGLTDICCGYGWNADVWTYGVMLYQSPGMNDEQKFHTA